MSRQRFNVGSVLRWLWPLYVLLMGVGIYLLTLDAAPAVLSWETASEVDTAGFNIYRTEVPRSEPEMEPSWVRVNPTIIPAKGSEVAGAMYRFEDKDVVPGRRYRYQIEEVEWDGTLIRYPQVVELRAGLPRIVTRVEGIGLLVLGAILLAWHVSRGASWHSYDENNSPQGQSQAP